MYTPQNIPRKRPFLPFCLTSVVFLMNSFSLGSRQKGACLPRCPTQSELYWRRTDRIEPGEHWRFAGEERLQDKRLLSSPGCAVLMCCCLFCCGGEAAAAMPTSEALLSAKFFGEGGLFSQTAWS